MQFFATIFFFSLVLSFCFCEGTFSEDEWEDLNMIKYTEWVGYSCTGEIDTLNTFIEDHCYLLLDYSRKYSYDSEKEEVTWENYKESNGCSAEQTDYSFKVEVCYNDTEAGSSYMFHYFPLDERNIAKLTVHIDSPECDAEEFFQVTFIDGYCYPENGNSTIVKISEENVIGYDYTNEECQDPVEKTETHPYDTCFIPDGNDEENGLYATLQYAEEVDETSAAGFVVCSFLLLFFTIINHF
ncbi:hypothetical protein M0813_26241 [Anaeramoeba flamelloides]|uniref:Uncharacterized protein n=1 Tax=Anaeramoeba flamelloides TaxID=1746091 RepID=A0ABQ8Y0B2_9EUKA|nr:hypothetical protein M0813_26241 [Anaeramoeba flamelloides]